MSKTIENAGFPLCEGCVIGKTLKISDAKNPYENKSIKKEEIEQELQRLENSLVKANEDIDNTLENISSENNNLNEIIKIHKSILNDPEIKKGIIDLIKNKLHSMEHAINQKFMEIENSFATIKNPYLKERVNDYVFVKNTLINKPAKKEEGEINEPTILLMKDISPEQVIRYHNNKNILGICLKHGSRTSHASIIIKSLNLPAIIETSTNYKSIPNNKLVVFNSYENKLVINPEKSDIIECDRIIEKEQENLNKLQELVKKPAITKSGKRIKLRANLEFEEEIPLAIKNGAEGVGLLRTEMFYLNRKMLPSKEEQFTYYKKIVSSFENSVTIRTLDLGGDKNTLLLKTKKEENPNLGLRGIRFSLSKPEIFVEQLEAILMASTYGKIKILLPMVSKIEEVRETKKILDNCKKKLREKNIPFDNNIQLGVMIEVPSAVFEVESFAKECDFFSIGTNDLTQYIMAIDRNNDHVKDYYDETNPAVLTALKIVVDGAKKHNKTVSLCGEIASNPEKLKTFIELDVDEVSVSTSSLLKIKEKIINYR